MPECRPLLGTAAGGELQLLHWVKSLSERIQRCPGEEEVLRAACPSDWLSHTHAHLLRPLPREAPGLRGEELSSVEEETGEDIEEGQKVPGSWKAVRRQRHDWKGPKGIKCGEEMFSASLDDLEGI